MRLLLIITLLAFGTSTFAQGVWEKPISAEQKLEQAKKEEAEAKKAVKEAKKAAKQEKKNAKIAEKKGEAKAAETTSEKAKKAPKNKTKQLTVEQQQYYDKYVAKGTVPEVDGRVVFSLEKDIPGKGAQEMYDRTYAFLEELVGMDNQIESDIVLINKEEHIVVAKVKEWLVFSQSLLALDRAEFSYLMIIECKDGHVKATMERIFYSYEKERQTGFTAPAEELISDAHAVNAKKGKLYNSTERFRRATIDRKDFLFDALVGTLKR